MAGGDEPYLFYLDKGVQTITMEVVLGELTESLVAASQSMDHLNNASWRLLTLIGSDPIYIAITILINICPMW